MCRGVLWNGDIFFLAHRRGTKISNDVMKIVVGTFSYLVNPTSMRFLVFTMVKRKSQRSLTSYFEVQYNEKDLGIRFIDILGIYSVWWQFFPQKRFLYYYNFWKNIYQSFECAASITDNFIVKKNSYCNSMDSYLFSLCTVCKDWWSFLYF